MVLDVERWEEVLLLILKKSARSRGKGTSEWSANVGDSV